MKPVYWKPKYGTRSSRHRAFVRRQAAREEALKRAQQGPGIWARFRAWLLARPGRLSSRRAKPDSAER